ncbi:MAG: hypothetical protein N2V74_01730 [Candidatus Methanospirare jalkutatii]|nr:MAG: hypothetical protein N2V74_04130 [Candidatus Methanospirare jalkutatii]UYZ40442.1 MAG: hypothetical protein N2V74_01730 [Candidatus Methanospirare jalkutatii]
MNKVQSAIAETLAKYPWMGKEELVSLIIDYIERFLVEAITRIKLPSRAELMREMFKEKRKKRTFRMSEEEFREKEAFINLLRNLKFEKEGVKQLIDSDLFYFDGRNENGNEDEGVQLEASLSSGIAKVELRIDTDFMEIEENRGDFTYLMHERSIVSSIACPEEKIDEVIERIRSIAEEISQNNVRDVRLDYDKDYGRIVEVVLNQNDKEAFETWLRLIEEVRPKELGIVLSVDWTGENILSEEAFVRYAVEVMLRSGVGPIRKDKFSAVKEVEEGWL